jgi:hypothetical protein
MQRIAADIDPVSCAVDRTLVSSASPLVALHFLRASPVVPKYTEHRDQRAISVDTHTETSTAFVRDYIDKIRVRHWMPPHVARAGPAATGNQGPRRDTAGGKLMPVAPRISACRTL